MSQIDHSIFENVRALQRPGAPDIVARIVNSFADQTPESVESIMEAIEAKDFDGIRMNAHSVKSSAAYVGAMEFSKRMANLEKAARDERLSICEQLADGLVDHCHRVISELRYLKDKAA